MLTETAREYCGKTYQRTRLERLTEPATYRIHPQDVFRWTNTPESMSTIHLTKVSKGVFAKRGRDKRILCKDARRGKWKGGAHPNVRSGPLSKESRLRNGGETQHHKTHLKREAPREVGSQQGELAWGIWTLDKLLHASLDVRRAPQSIG